MKKLLANLVLLSFLLGTVSFFCFNFRSAMVNNQATASQKCIPPLAVAMNSKIKSSVTADIKPEVGASIELNSAQNIAYHKVDANKIKLLHRILNDGAQRKKFQYVMKKAAELQLPTELALIPVIESEYKNNAVSHKGAAGVWQLMPGTAKIFGLSKKQRFEMIASTRAALLHFRDLYNEFGDWELAIAAYNAGDGKVSKALRKKGSAKTVQDLKLPRETRNYVLAFFQLQKALKTYDLT